MNRYMMCVFYRSLPFVEGKPCKFYSIFLNNQEKQKNKK